MNHSLMRMAPALLLTALPATWAASPALESIPDADQYCRAAQRVVTRTDQPVELVVHEQFDAFVKSKAVIEGPQIQQFNWQDENGVFGISCKLKSADHLNLAFGDGTAGPDGLCQDMNRAVYSLILPTITQRAYDAVAFDPQETVSNTEQPGMTGPDWLAPYAATSVSDNGTLVIRTKGFIVNFTDPQFEQAPPRFRGVHYCHFLAPEHLRALLQGKAEPGIVIGRAVDTSGPAPGGSSAHQD